MQTPQTNLYSGYESWKRWDKLFTYSREDGTYFNGELRDVKVRDAVLLEIGFGSGNFIAWARDNGATVVGTEINGASLAAARERGIEIVEAEYEHVADAHRARFDTIVALDVFEHFTIDEVAIRLEAAEQMLKDGGKLVLRFPNAQSPFGLAPQNGDPTHKSALSRSVFEQLIQGRRLQVVRYSHSYRVGGGGLLRGIARFVRGAMRDAICAFLNFTYSQSIPWDPVVVLVLQKVEQRPLS